MKLYVILKWKTSSDKKAVPIFNSDNCNGDYFYIDNVEKVVD